MQPTASAYESKLSTLHRLFAAAVKAGPEITTSNFFPVLLLKVFNLISKTKLFLNYSLRIFKVYTVQLSRFVSLSLSFLTEAT